MAHNSVDIGSELFSKRPMIEEWFQEQWSTLTPTFYTSVDLRHSGFKLAPVDVNVYPAGFNNLSAPDKDYAAIQAKALLHKIQGHCQCLLLIAEDHTRNMYYLENIKALQNLLSQAGFIVKLSQLSSSPQAITLPSGEALSFEGISKHNGYLKAGDFVPDCIILNNDLSTGLSELLVDIYQPILPSPILGWYRRKKSQCFTHYRTLCKEFSGTLDIDHWFIDPLFDVCEHINFKHTTYQEALLKTASGLLDSIDEKYQSYHISETPYLIIKADAGSYGMGILAVHDINSLSHLSRKQRQHMTTTKGSRPIQSVIVQEGIPTITRVEQKVAEPVIYLIGSKVVGGFHRIHNTRHPNENLNTPGMTLEPIQVSCESPSIDSKLLYAYQVIARLAGLATALEMTASTFNNTSAPV